MAGLNLMGGGALYSGNYQAAAVPRPANNPSSTIAQRAGFGITTPGSGVSRVPAYGSLAVGIAGVGVLLWLWYSLPR